jgi:Cys-tRNA(Pro) deacylase
VSRGQDSETPATRLLSERGIAYERRPYPYQERGGAAHAAECLGVELHAVVKTLVMKSDRGQAVVVLMHGDDRVSFKRLAVELGARRATACSPAEALALTGYRVGGISPFGLKRELPVLVEASILELPRIWINAGRRGLLLEIDPRQLPQALTVRSVRVRAG